MPEQETKEPIMPELNEADVVQGNNVVDGEGKNAQVDGGSASSVAPSVDALSDTQGMIMAEEKMRKNGKKEIFKFPKLFVKPENLIEVDVDVIFDPTNGDVYSITQTGLFDMEKLDLLDCVSYYFKFKPVTYDNIQVYRKQASFYDSSAGDLVINRLTLRSLFLINHLKETNMVDENGKPIEIEIDKNTDVLSLSGVSELFKTIPALLDVVMTLFERKLLFLFQVGG